MSPGKNRDPAGTRRRLLAAARDEFAALGIAGARVDQIATAASSTKSQIYHYFESKDALFDAVFEDMCRETVDAVPIDASDLPQYAASLFDSYQQRPWVQRLATWHRLERGSDKVVELVVASNRSKVSVIEQAQTDGLLPTTFTGVELLGLLLHLSGFWESNIPEFDVLASTVTTDRRRSVIVAAVEALLRSDDRR